MYYVSIEGGVNTQLGFTLNPSSSRTSSLPEGIYSVQTEQMNGYIFYPTVRNYTVKILGGNTETINID